MESVADRVRSIADTADRPGVYRLLHEIADELDAEPCEWCHGNRPPVNVVAPPCHRCHGTGSQGGA